VQHLMIAAGLHRPVLLGTSFGGLIATALGALMPGLARAVVLNDSGPQMERSFVLSLTERLGRDVALPDLATAQAHLRRLLPNLGLRTAEDWEAFTQATYRQGADGRLHPDWDLRLGEWLRDTSAPNSSQERDLWGLFRGLKHLPVLAIRGGISPALSPETFRGMKEAKPDLFQIEVAGLGHSPCLEEEEVRSALDGFLRHCGT